MLSRAGRGRAKQLGVEPARSSVKAKCELSRKDPSKMKTKRSTSTSRLSHPTGPGSIPRTLPLAKPYRVSGLVQRKGLAFLTAV